MSCRHSSVINSGPCSQCVGATPKVITRDPVSGLLHVDGVLLQSRLFILPPQSPGGAKRGRPRKPRDVDRDD